MKRITYAMALLLVLSIPACARDKAEPSGPVTLVPVASGIKKPTAIVHAGDGSGRLFVLEQEGRIIELSGPDLGSRKIFLDISDKVGCCGERGLLGLAFRDGSFYLDYTDKQGDTVVSRFDMKDGRAAPASEKIIMAVAQPFGNHNGGQIAFGPDGYLYIALGDGGSGGDPQGNGQNPGTLLGSILRLDVSGEGQGYGIPGDNPFMGMEGRRPEIWAWGLRNPWRFSFDPMTGDLYIADVGQNKYEEINFEPAGSKGGLNYGWNIMEGMHCFKQKDCKTEGLVLPVSEYTHEEGCSVTGGYVYRGKDAVDLDGVYLFSDYCTGKLWGLSRTGGKWKTEKLMETGKRVSTFGQDESGRVYLADYGSGDIFRIEARR